VVKYLNLAAASVTVVSVILDAAVPVAQQLGKNKQAKAGIEGAINLTILFTLVRTVPRLIGAVRTFRAQLATPVRK
jgi:hypothetical protein